MQPLDTDAHAIEQSLREHEKDLWCKRKFLMGLYAVPGNDHHMRSYARNQSFLPESFLRKDDVFYEDVKQLVEKGFGAVNTHIWQEITPDDVEFRDLHSMLKSILTSLDDFSNSGLYHLAKIVTRDSVAFCKTRSQMKKVIKKGLSDIQNSNLPNDHARTQSEISQLLKNQRSFRQNHVQHLNMTLKSHSDVVMKVVNGLEAMHTRTLLAMHRKLNGAPGYMPQLYPPRTGWKRDILIDRVRALCLGMINQLGPADKLPEPLAKAMAVAGLSSRIYAFQHDLSQATFVHLTPEVETLQNQLLKAIHSFKALFQKKHKLKTVVHLLDPGHKGERRIIARAVKNMLVDFLFECSDMEAIPDSLLDALSYINKMRPSMHRLLTKDFLEEELECILNVSAHIRQVLWDHVSVDDIDQDFASAYMEELEESDDGDIFDEDDDRPQLHIDALHEVHVKLNVFNEEVQSTGDPEQASFGSSLGHLDDTNESSSSSFGATGYVDDVLCANTDIGGGDLLMSTSSGSDASPLGSPILQKSGDSVDSQDPENNAAVDSVNLTCSEENPMPEDQDKVKNRYAVVQQVCDQVSVVAYQLLGHVLEEFGRREALELDGDDQLYLFGEYSRPEQFQGLLANSIDKDSDGAIIVRAVHKVVPSLSNSELEIVKKIMSL